MAVSVLARRLSRTFRIVDREPGLRGAIESIVGRRYRSLDAVVDADFEARSGEVLALLGPNGAGKTTTLKMVAGLLTPTAGDIRVLGYEPSRREGDFLRRIGFVMGQRWQLHPDLPVGDSLDVLRVVYDLTRDEAAITRAELVESLDIGGLLSQPARELSLGQRMRCEIAATLQHRPEVVLLDEPTLGLDFDGQVAIRRFFADYVGRHRACVILTSHYLADVEALAHRVMTISEGRITFDGTLDDLRAHGGDDKRLVARVSDDADVEAMATIGAVIEVTPGRVVVSVPRTEAGMTLTALQATRGVIDVTVVDPPLEDTLSELYGTGDGA